MYMQNLFLSTSEYETEHLDDIIYCWMRRQISKYCEHDNFFFFVYEIIDWMVYDLANLNLNSKL